MIYVKLLNNVVVQRQSYPQEGFEEAPEGTICGMLKSGNSFVSPPADIAKLKLQKNEEINQARLKANFTSFIHAGKAIACDELSRSDIDGTNGYVALNSSLPPIWPGGWKAIDNTYVSITTVDEWKAFYLSMFAAGNANFAKDQTLKATLAAATTEDQVKAIVW